MDGKPYSAKSGDCIFYEGPKYEHWREPYKGETCCQVFMHYVDAHGPNTNVAYDDTNHLKYPKEIYPQISRDVQKSHGIAFSKGPTW